MNTNQNYWKIKSVKGKGPLLRFGNNFRPHPYMNWSVSTYILCLKADGNVCVILLSEIVWEKFRCGTGFQEPFIVHFPDYNKGTWKRFFWQFTNGIVAKSCKWRGRNFWTFSLINGFNFMSFIFIFLDFPHCSIFKKDLANIQQNNWKIFQPFHISLIMPILYICKTN